MTSITKAQTLSRVSFDILGLVQQKAQEMEAGGERVIKLNIGNLAPFGFAPSAEVREYLRRHLDAAASYSEGQGLLAVRLAVQMALVAKGWRDVGVDDIYLGNGVSELVQIALGALLNPGDEVLVPTPDYPMWTATTTFAHGVPRHYLCDEGSGWLPDLDSIRQSITPRTRALVVINPNNPTGALYPLATLEALIDIARQHRLVLFVDEVYDSVLYDGAEHIPLATLADDVLVISMNGLSKNHCACGYRAAWMVVSGARQMSADYIAGLRMAASMRICANVLGQMAVIPALQGAAAITGLLTPHSGRLWQQREAAYQALVAIPGVSCVKPAATFYLFPHLDRERYPVADDERFALDLLTEERVLIVQGSGFNWVDQQHFRLVFLAEAAVLKEAIARLGGFLQRRYPA